MPRVPYPEPRPSFFTDRFALPVPPQFTTGNMEAARDTLMRGLSPADNADLTKLLQSLMLKEALSQPFPQTFRPEGMPEPEPVDMLGPKPVPLLEIPNPQSKLTPIEESMHPSVNLPPDAYSRVGFPEAVNPMTFMARLSNNYVPNDAAVKQFEGELPPIDPAQELVNQEIDNPRGD